MRLAGKAGRLVVLNTRLNVVLVRNDLDLNYGVKSQAAAGYCPCKAEYSLNMDGTWSMHWEPTCTTWLWVPAGEELTSVT